MFELFISHLREIAVISIVLALVASFVFFFVLPSIEIAKKVNEIIKRIDASKANTSPNEVLGMFEQEKDLKAIWREYSKTLHTQQEILNGEIKTTGVFSTVTSDAYFNPESVFEGRINSEFFKHLPGILTGLGIIGTFIGLIVGLQSFASIQLGNPQATQRGLQDLMQAVGGAFVVSALAIVAAMAVTFVEKLLVKRLTSLVHELAQSIDALYDAGASEDYLARLVKASEEASAQTKILKDALVQELGDLLRELTEAQINASTTNAKSLESNLQAQSKEIGSAVSSSITEGLKEPLDKVAQLVATASGEQSSAASKMLQEVMTSFSQKLNDLFGDQITEINRLNQEAASSIKEAVDGIQKLMNALQDSGQKTADEMSQRMLDAIERMASRQDQINTQSSAFVEDLKRIIAEGQSQTQDKMVETLSIIQEQMVKLSASMSGAQTEVFEKNRTREQEMSDRASTLVNGMSDSVSSAVEEISKATRTIAESIDTLGRTTSSAIDRMNTGAQLIAIASEDFSKAGNSVGTVLNQTTGLVEKITTTSTQLSSSASSLQDALSDYQSQRSSLNSMFAEFKQVIELAKKETSLTADVLSKLERATSQLGQAEQAAEEYLSDVTKVLAETHESFTREMTNSLTTANRGFHQNLKSAIDLLATTITDLDAALGSGIGRKN